MLPTPVRELGIDAVDETSGTSMRSFASIVAILRFRANTNPKQVAFTILDGKGKEISSITFEKLNSRAERVSQLLKEKSRLQRGDHVALLFRRNEMIDFLVSLYGCFYAGMIAVPTVTHSLTLEDELTEILFVWESCHVSYVLTTDASYKSITKDSQNCDAAKFPPQLEWWKVNEFGSYHPKRKGVEELINVNADDVAYVEYSKSQIRELKGVVMDHRAIMNVCSVDKAVQEYKATDVLLLSVEPRQQIGFLIGAFWSIFNGGQTLYLVDGLYDQIQGVWAQVVNKYKVSFCLHEYPFMLDVLNTHRDFQPSRKHPVDLSTLRSLLITTFDAHVGFHEDIVTILGRFGFKGRDYIRPLFTLPEFGGIFVSVRDKEAQIGEWTLDRAALREDILVLEPKSKVGANAFLRSQVVKRSQLSQSKRIEDLGCLIPEMAVAIVDPVSCTLLPKNKIGEIWIHAPSLLPRGFWTLPKLTEQTFHAHPVLVTTELPLPPYYRHTSTLASMETDQKEVYVAVDERNFLRTGFYGAVLDPEICRSPSVGMHDWPESRRRLYVSSLKKDRFKVQGSCFSTLDVASTVIERVPYVEACSVSCTVINKSNLPVVLLETSLSREELPNCVEMIRTVLLDIHKLSVYDVTVCERGSLPRLVHPELPNTGFQSLFCGHVIDIVSLAMNEASFNTTGLVAKSKWEGIDMELAHQAWECGQLMPLYVKLDCENGLVGALPSSLKNTVEGTSGLQDLEALLESRSNGSQLGQISGEFREVLVLDDASCKDLDHFDSIMHLLLWRANETPDDTAFSLLDVRGREAKTIGYKKLVTKIMGMAAYFDKKGLKAGQHVICLFPHGLDYIVSLYACFYVGLVAIPLPPPDPNRLKEDIPLLLSVADEFSCECVLVNQTVEDSFKSKPIQSMVKAVRQRQAETDPQLAGKYPSLINTSKAGKLNKVGVQPLEDPLFIAGLGTPASSYYTPPAVVLVSFSADMKHTCVRLCHKNLLMQCRQMAIHDQMLQSVMPDYLPLAQGSSNSISSTIPPSRPLISCARAYNGLGFVYGVLLGVYVGAVTLVLPPLDFFLNPQVWFEMIHKYKVKDALTTYPMLEHAMSVIRNVDYRSFSLHNLKSMMILTEGRSRPEIYQLLTKNLLANRLEESAIAPVYSPLVNALTTSRAYTQSEVTRLTLSLKALRDGKVAVLKEERGAHCVQFGGPQLEGELEQSIILQDTGKVVTNTLVAIVDPSTGRLCPPDHVGEIWVASPSNVDGYYGDLVAEIFANNESFHQSQFGATLDGYFTTTIDGNTTPILFARTGDKGFLYPVPVNEEALSLSRAADASAAHNQNPLHVTGWNAYTKSSSPTSYEVLLFVIGSMQEDFVVNGLRHFPCDIEATLERSHGSIPTEGTIVFQTDDGSIVAAVEVVNEADVYNCIPVLVNSTLREHQFFLNRIIFLQEGTLAKSRLSEKQRYKVAMAYKLGKLPVLFSYTVTV